MDDFVMIDVPMQASVENVQQNEESPLQLHEPDNLFETLQGSQSELGLRSESLSSDEDTKGFLPPAEAMWKPTGCCYDERMAYHINPDAQGTAHPEAPERIGEIMRSFKETGLVFSGTNDELRHVLKTDPTRYMWRIPARFAMKSEICTVHTADQYQWVEDLPNKSPAELSKISSQMEAGRKSLYVSSLTYQAALLAAGSAIETCKNVVEGRVKNAIAIIRPPGHHAEANESMGFCVFNNVPVAAAVCRIDFPTTCKKVLILDWDVHHGNGTQNMFYNDPNVLYISLHVYDNGAFYPGQPDDPNIPDGGLENVGRGAGAGMNINIPWHDQGVGDGEYMLAFQKIIMPVAMEYEPDLVIISAGFDAAAGDELGGCFVSPECYAHMTHMLMSLAGGKVAVCLEGGYNLQALRQSAQAVAETLMGIPPPKMKIPLIHYKAALVLDKVMETHAPYWDCLRRYRVPTFEHGAERIHDVIRRFQYTTMREKHGMLPMYIMRDSLYKSFEFQILATPDANKSKKILLILHDPPELLAKPDPLDGNVDSHNAWMVDGVVPYIDWAVKNEFAVVDINIPAYITQPHVHPDSYIPPLGETDKTPMMRDLMTWLWDNNLDLWLAESIILIGVGNSNFGIRMLLTLRDVRARITGIVNFVMGNIRPIRSETDDGLAGWYKTHSRVYVGAEHACWKSPELEKKVRQRRYGTVIKSDVVGLNKMLNSHFEETTTWITVMAGDNEDGEEESKTTVIADRGEGGNVMDV